jgi:hypothetical protein
MSKFMEEEPFPEPDFAHAADPFPDPEPSVMVVEDDSDDYGPFKQTSSSPLNQSNVGVSFRFVPSHQYKLLLIPKWERRIPMRVHAPSDVGVMGGTYSDAGGAARSDVGVYSDVGAKSDVGVASDGGVNSNVGQVPTDIIREN